MLHRIGDFLSRGQLKDSGYSHYLPTYGVYLFRWGAGAPTGTADAFYYFNTTGTTNITSLYTNVNGTWTVLSQAGGANGVTIPSGKTWSLAGNTPAANIVITNAASTANISLVTFQLNDATGAALAKATSMTIWLSDTATTGAGLTGTTASGAVAAGASGTDLATLVSKKALHVLTDATGKYILSITDTAKTLFVPCASVAGITVAGTALTTGSYG